MDFFGGSSYSRFFAKAPFRYVASIKVNEYIIEMVKQVSVHAELLALLFLNLKWSSANSPQGQTKRRKKASKLLQ